MSSGTYRGTTPTKPMIPRVREPGDDEGEPTMQRCPLCLTHGYVLPEHAIAFEAWCAKLHEEQK